MTTRQAAKKATVAPTDDATGADSPVEPVDEGTADASGTETVDNPVFDDDHPAPAGAHGEDALERMRADGTGPFAAPLEHPQNPVPILENISRDSMIQSDREPMEAFAAAPKSFNADKAYLVDEDDNPVRIEDVFDEAVGPQTFRAVNRRVYKVEPLPGSDTHTSKTLLYPEGARVNVFDVAQAMLAWKSVDTDDDE